MKEEINMITIYKKSGSIAQTDNRSNEIELRGLSTDTKPSASDNKDLANGTLFVEIDTGKFYAYDLENDEWKEI